MRLAVDPCLDLVLRKIVDRSFSLPLLTHLAYALIDTPLPTHHAVCIQSERTEILWRALEQIIPDVRSRVKVGLEGTPLTHERFLRRDRGTYGPKIRAGMDQYPSNKPPVEGLWLCGDSVFPGIGMPVRFVAFSVGC